MTDRGGEYSRGDQLIGLRDVGHGQQRAGNNRGCNCSDKAM